TTDAILDDALVRSFVLRCMAEAAEIGARIGCPIAQSGEERLDLTRELGVFRTSMLQDSDAGRPLELDALVTAVDEIGGRVGVAWTLGDAFHVLRGGTQRRTGLQSRIEVHPIIAVRGAVPSRAWRRSPALSNPKLFARDRQVCAYCSGRFPIDDLTREHIVPT